MKDFVEDKSINPNVTLLFKYQEALNYLKKLVNIEKLFSHNRTLFMNKSNEWTLKIRKMNICSSLLPLKKTCEFSQQELLEVIEDDEDLKTMFNKK